MNVLMVAVAGTAALVASVGVNIGIAKLRKRDWRTGLRGPALGATVGVAVAAAASTMHSKPPARATDRYRSQLESDPAFVALRKSDPNAKETLAGLTQEGMRRLSPGQVREAGALMLKVAEADAGACSAMWPATPDRAAVASGIKALAPADHDALMQLSTDATLRGLHHDGDLRPAVTDPDARGALFLAACDALPPSDGARLRALILQGAATKADACEGTKLLFRAMLKLPDDQAGQVFVGML